MKRETTDFIVSQGESSLGKQWVEAVEDIINDLQAPFVDDSWDEKRLFMEVKARKLAVISLESKLLNLLITANRDINRVEPGNKQFM